MSKKIPKHGRTALQFVLEEGRGLYAWRPVAISLDQREALAMLDAGPSSYALRVVQVVAVRLPAGEPTAAERAEFDRHSREIAALACAMQECEAPAAPGSRWCSGHAAGLPSNARREGEYGPDRYAGEECERRPHPWFPRSRDFPRPRGVTP